MWRVWPAFGCPFQEVLGVLAVVWVLAHSSRKVGAVVMREAAPGKWFIVETVCGGFGGMGGSLSLWVTGLWNWVSVKLPHLLGLGGFPGSVRQDFMEITRPLRWFLH